MRLYKLHTRQFLPISLTEAWEFLSNPENLSKITPEDMNFTIISGAEREMFPGQIIEYVVSPFPFVKMGWVTEITYVAEGRYFVDEQRFGPYSFWHHKHFLREKNGGVEMEDIVDYALPFGLLGRLAHALFVKRRLEKIFEHRRFQLENFFGTAIKVDSPYALKTV